MTDPTLQKLVLQLLPAVAAANREMKPATPEGVRKMWSDYMDEAKSVAFLYEEKFINPPPPTEVFPPSGTVEVALTEKGKNSP